MIDAGSVLAHKNVCVGDVLYLKTFVNTRLMNWTIWPGTIIIVIGITMQPSQAQIEFVTNDGRTGTMLAWNDLFDRYFKYIS